MFRFFRNIRKTLVEHLPTGPAGSKVRTYLFYAIGEIALVMIGILLALQVNNWNESKSLKSQEKVYLELIRDDLILQKEENEIQRSTLLSHISVKDRLSELIVKRFQVGEDQRGEVKKLLSSLLVGRTYGAYEATFIDLTSSGNTGLISNPELKNRIIQHYQIQKRDRDVINNNALNTYLQLWIKLADRNAIMIAPNLDQFAIGSIDNNSLQFNTSFDFLDDTLFEHLSGDENLLLIQNVLAFKISATRIAVKFLDNSDDRMDRLIQDIEAEMREL